MDGKRVDLALTRSYKN